MVMSHGCKAHSRNFLIFHSWFECNFFNENLTLALWLKLELPLISWFQQKWNWDFHAFFFITVFGCSWFFQYNLVSLHGICHNSTHQVQFELPPTSFPCQHHQTFEVAKRRWVFDWVIFWLFFADHHFWIKKLHIIHATSHISAPWLKLKHIAPSLHTNNSSQQWLSRGHKFFIGFSVLHWFFQMITIFFN